MQTRSACTNAPTHSLAHSLTLSLSLTHTHIPTLTLRHTDHAFTPWHTQKGIGALNLYKLTSKEQFTGGIFRRSTVTLERKHPHKMARTQREGHNRCNLTHKHVCAGYMCVFADLHSTSTWSMLHTKLLRYAHRHTAACPLPSCLHPQIRKEGGNKKSTKATKYSQSQVSDRGHQGPKYFESTPRPGFSF